jgi:dimethylglycine dehydrogenase
MTEKARVAVIGGGIVGCAMLYYLTRQGCSDALLIEKGELTSGSTWHAAGQVPFYSPHPFFSRIHKESFDTFERVQEETGEPVGLHKCGSVRLGHTAEEILEYRRFAGFARHLGIDCAIISADEARALFPYFEGPDFAGALYVPSDGFTDPTQTTNGLAKAARAAGAKILRHTRVEAIRRRPQGGWRIETPGATVEADIVVNCAGAWSPRISAMVGGRLPMTAIEHQYFVTESVPGLAERTEELPILRNMSVPYYIRQERDGFLVAAYEEETLYWGDGAPPWDFDQALLPPDLDRAMPFIEATMAEVPVLGTVGVKTVVNGPTPRSADLTPLAGPAHGYPDFFVMTGVVGGFLQCGTARFVAEWILDGAPSIDLSPVDVRRFGEYATRAYTEAKLDVAHAYSGSVYHPHTESSAGRGARMSAVHDRLAAKGAVFGARNGWEVPNWFAPEGTEAKDASSYRRANWFAPVGAECRAVRAGVGIIDLSSLAKFSVGGPEAEAVLARLSANRLPERPGAMAMAPIVNARGGLDAWLAVTRMEDGDFLLTGSAACEQRDRDLLRRAVEGKDARAENVTDAWGVLAIAGPKAAALLAAVSRLDTNEAAFPAFTAQECEIGFCHALVQRCSATGEDGFEIFARPSALPALYDRLHQAGAAFGLTDFGQRALDSLRLEAGRPRQGIELGTDTDPTDAGFGRYLRAPKGGGPRRLAWLLMDDGAGPETSDPWGGEGVLAGGETIGVTSSGGFGHTIGKRIATAWLPPEHTAPGTTLEVELLGERIAATVSEPPFHRG